MAISTETEALIELYNQKIELDKKQLEQVNYAQNGYTIRTGVGASDTIKIWGTGEVIQNYDSSIVRLDNRIIELNTQISILQSEILSWGQQASALGCGTTLFLSAVSQDDIKYKGYSYSGSNPFSTIQGTLSEENAGIGTENYTEQTFIGTYNGDIGNCYSIFCNDEICAGFAATITNLQDQIAPLQTERNDLIYRVNFLKNGRSQYQLQNYAFERSKTQINASIGVSSSILSFLEDPTNQEWL